MHDGQDLKHPLVYTYTIGLHNVKDFIVLPRLRRFFRQSRVFCSRYYPQANRLTYAQSWNGQDVRMATTKYMFLLPFIATVATFANLLTMVAFWKEPKLREKPSDLLIFALACVDFLTGLIVVPLITPLYVIPGDWPLGEFGCRTLVSTSTAALTGSMFLLIAISLDRLLLVSVQYPRYIKIQSKRQIYLNIGVAIGAAIFVSLLGQSFWNVAKTLDVIAANINFNKICLSPSRRVAAFSSAFFIIFYCIPVLIVGFLSVGFLLFLRKRIKKGNRIRDQGGSTTSQSGTGVSSQIRTVSTMVSNGEEATSDRSTVSRHNRYI